ncbi:MAG TPA: MarR family winged helix-turn-helix transcriptional regulator [Candidatus Acidoferrales bacterium]|nr:MarR family winged helix-turn-helix transcriptional regulator [Candidatus Acidoferrales bacterium]
MDRRAIERVRSFSRIVAERTGTVADRFLNRPRPYGESRVLWQIGRDGCDVRDLRAKLGLDSGYVSRVLRSLEKQRLIKVGTSRADRRVRHATLTAAGRKEREEVDRRASAAARSLLEPLGEKQRERLVAAMRDVETLLGASLVSFAVEDPNTRDAQWCLEQYFAELAIRFPGGFDPDQSIFKTADHFKPPEGYFLVARLHGEPVACGAILLLEKSRAYFKRMWVSKSVRGIGLGRRLLLRLEQLARDARAKTACLETHSALTEAIEMYRSAGYREVPPFNDEHYAHHWFEKRLV